MTVYIALRKGKRTTTLLELFLEPPGLIESQVPIILASTAGSNHQIYRGFGEF